jgi:large subunit ribosomal protein L7/L12
MALSKDEILDAIAGMTVLELSELIKAMEEKFGVSAAAAAVAVAAAPPPVAPPPRRRREDRIHRHADAAGEKKVERHQGGACSDRPGPEGSQGPGRRRAEGRQGRHPKADAEALEAAQDAGAKVELK